MTTKTLLITVSVTFLLGAAIGAYLVPTKTKIETRTVEVEKKTDVTDTKSTKVEHKRVVKHETRKPDGTTETYTTTTDDTDAGRDTHSTDTETKDITVLATRETARGSKTLNISVLGGVDLSGGLSARLPVVYGAHVSTSLIGPISVGVFGLSSGVGGASLGLNF